jgi:hypothetical protein
MELVPGHSATAAEVWLWRGEVPDDGDNSTPRVVLRADDWPMSSAAARKLAAALLIAAERAEQVAPESGTGSGTVPSPTASRA